MNQREGRELDRHLTDPPPTCEEDGHSWRYLGQNSEGDTYYKCRRCGQESED